MRPIGVIGLGAVGSAVIHGLRRFHECVGFDSEDGYAWEPILGTGVVFVCVPTPLGEDGHLDCSAVEQVLSRLDSSGYGGLIVVKSTVRVGFMGEVSSRFPRLRLVYMPEFLREKSRYTWFLSPDRLLFGGGTEEVTEALSYFSWSKGAATIKTDYRTAEIGKLAHNAYIATKVTFTNEIERICVQNGADPLAVMRVVTTDRRVLSEAHLQPGRGPYGGKCVPKDTRELVTTARMGVPMLASAADSAGPTAPNPVEGCSLQIVVVIPTKDRPEKLGRALSSVASQVRKPDCVLVVTDYGLRGPEETSLEIRKWIPVLDVREIPNHGVTNVSGALNTALTTLQEMCPSANSVFVAVLDDDDWWNSRYLDNVSTYAQETEADWVISGLIRHEGPGSAGECQMIPEKLSPESFLVSNPNVQGSNLFVRLSRLLEAGGFDEALMSTTDRDLCIRLLKVQGIRYEVLRNHLVHHDASPDPNRLSTPGSVQKKAGLIAFYRKYRREMTPDQDFAFRERALRVFGIDIPVNA